MQSEKTEIQAGSQEVGKVLAKDASHQREGFDVTRQQLEDVWNSQDGGNEGGTAASSEGDHQNNQKDASTTEGKDSWKKFRVGPFKSKFFKKWEKHWSMEQEQQAIYAYIDIQAMLREKTTENPKQLEEILKGIHPDLTTAYVEQACEDLKQDQAEVFKRVNDLFSGKKFEDAKARHKQLVTSRFKFDGTGKVREAVLVPNSSMVTPRQVKELLSKHHWSMSPPDKLVTFDFGTKHKTHMMTEHLLEQPAFAELKKSAKRAAKNNNSDPKSWEPEIKRMMGKFLEELLEEVTQAVVEASFMSSSWVLIDRRSHTSSSETAEHFLECCKFASSKLPVFLVLESISRFKAFKPSYEVVKQLLALGDIIHGASGSQEISRPQKLYSVQDFQSWEKFHYRKDRGGSDEHGNVWLPREPEGKMVDKAERLGDGRYSLKKEIKWVYHYQQYLYQSGSHYVIFQDADTSDFPMRTTGHEDWPAAKIFAGGGNLAFDRLIHAFRAGIPTVLLGNTGGVTQVFADLYKICVQEKNSRVQDENSNTKILNALLQRMESKANFGKRIGPSTVDLMLRLNRRAPEKMRRAYATVNVLKDSADKVIEKVTGCFAAGGVGFPELGLGTAEEDVVLIAWQLSMTFDKSAWVFRLKADILYYVSSLFTFVTGTLCVMTMLYRDDLEATVLFHKVDEKLPFMQEDVTADSWVRWTLVALPIVSTFVTGILSKKRYLQKWAVLYDVSRKIVKEIYEFRTRTNDYDITRLAAKVEEDEEKGGEAEGREQSARPGLTPATQWQARDYFAREISVLQKAALTEVADDSLSGDGAGALIDLTDRNAREELEKNIHAFVQDRLFGGVPGRCEICKGMLLGCLGCKQCCKRSSNKSKVAPQDSEDRVGVIGKAVRSSPKGLSPTASSKKSFRRKPSSRYSKSLDDDDEDESSGDEMDDDFEHNADEEDTDSVRIARDDYKSTMTIETYMEHRLKPLLDVSKKRTPRLASALSRYEIAILALNATTAFIAALNYSEWVAVVVLLVTAMSNLLQYQLINQRLTSHNSCVKELESLYTYLSSLSIVQRRTHSAKNLAVGVAESATLETVQAWTGIASKVSNRKASGAAADDSTTSEDSSQKKKQNKEQ